MAAKFAALLSTVSFRSVFRVARPLRWLGLGLACLPLAGCLQDAASYPLPGEDHAITLIRNQTWPWQDGVDVDVAIMRMPECNGSGRILAVPRDAPLSLYQAPPEYAEPLLILKTGTRYFAVSSTSCRMQEFKEEPDDDGKKLGEFVEQDGRFQFVAAGAKAGAEE